MQFKVNRDHLANGLAQVLNVVGVKQSSMPVLKNVLIEAADGAITLTTTNLDQCIRCQIKADIQESGGLTLPARKLHSVVRELPELTVQLETDTEHRARIVSGRSSFRLVGITQDDFPQLPTFADAGKVEVSQKELAAKLKSVSHAQSQDEQRYFLNGVFLRLQEEKLTVVATDGRRLAANVLELENSPVPVGQVIIPSRTVGELERLLGQGEAVTIAFDDRQIAFDILTGKEAEDKGLVGSVYMISKVIEGKFPDYTQVIPKETEHRIKLERELFSQSLHRVSLMVSEKVASARMKVVPNSLEVSSQNSGVGEAEESMAISYDGPEIQVAFNPYYMLDALRTLIKDEVFFEFKDEFSPGVIKTLDGFVCVVMPVRIP